jgi:biopolymer transport protein ExbD
MATIDLGSGDSRRKNVDANIPLIPFIDLLLCCVMFLLVTAVWNQLASHDVVQSVPGGSADAAPPDALKLVLQVNAGGYVLSSTAGDRFEIPKAGDRYDRAALCDRLKIYRASDPNRRDLTLNADDGVVYEAIVQAMDAAAEEGFVAFSFSDS